jgi:hypothetical protein
MEAAKLLQYPPILITVYYTSIVFATYYLICVSIEDTFALPPYSWSSIIVGVAYIPGGLGLLFGAIIGGRWQDYIMARTARKEGRYNDKGELILHPVDRLGENCLLGGILFPGALLWWGWAADKHEFWLVPVSSLISSSSGFKRGLIYFIAPRKLLLRVWRNDSHQRHHDNADRIYTEELHHRRRGE